MLHYTNIDITVVTTSGWQLTYCIFYYWHLGEEEFVIQVRSEHLYS